jgi:hypothetical protein
VDSRAWSRASLGSAACGDASSLTTLNTDTIVRA